MSENVTRTAPAFTIELPLFGTCDLIPHGMDEQPAGLFCYVTLEGGESATLAVYRNGEFQDRYRRPFASPIMRWYSVEKADGSIIF